METQFVIPRESKPLSSELITTMLQASTCLQCNHCYQGNLNKVDQSHHRTLAKVDRTNQRFNQSKQRYKAFTTS